MKTWKIAVGLTLTQLAMVASATPVTFDDRSAFEGQGVIAEFQDFESFDPNEFTFPGDPFVDGSITYTSPGENLIVGANTFINPLSNTLSYDQFDTALTGDIVGEFNLFGFDMAANTTGGGDVTLTLFTNLSSYLFDFALPEVQNDLLFQGFLLTGGEYFTGFAFSELNFVHIDNVALGEFVEVPTPSSLFLLGSAFLSLGLVRRQRGIRHARDRAWECRAGWMDRRLPVQA